MNKKLNGKEISLTRISRLQLITIMIFGIGTATFVVHASIQTNRSFLFTTTFASIFGVLGLILGYIVAVIIFSKVGKDFLQVGDFSNKELLIPIFSALIFWQIFRYIFYSEVAGLLAGWFIGYFIVRLLRKFRRLTT